MKNYTLLKGLSLIKNVLSQGYKILIVSPLGELETADSRTIEVFFNRDDCQFYQVNEIKYNNPIQTENEKLLKHIGDILNNFSLGMNIKKYNDFDEEVFNIHNERIPQWDFINYHYDLA